MSQDATRAGRAYMLAQMYVASLLETVVSVTLAFLVSWKLALLGIALGGTILMILGPFVKISKKAGRRQQSSTQGFVSLLTDMLIGIKPLKAMARQEHFLPLFGRETAPPAPGAAAPGDRREHGQRDARADLHAVRGDRDLSRPGALHGADVRIARDGDAALSHGRLPRPGPAPAAARDRARGLAPRDPPPDRRGRRRARGVRRPAAADARARLRLRAGLVRLWDEARARRGLARPSPPTG